MNIVIIGATSGIGKALFLKYANADNRIGIVGRRANLLNKLSRQHPSKTIIAKADVANLEEIEQAINTLHKELTHFDLVVMCAGVGDINATLDYAIERPAIDTNIVGWTYVIDRLYCIFEKQGFGHLVAITSAGGLRGEPAALAYSATKAYQINYMEAIRKKAFRNGGCITVTDVRPGLVDTAMAKGEGLFWVMSVEKVATQIISAISRKKSKVYVTKRWHILALLYRILPFYIFKRL